LKKTLTGEQKNDYELVHQSTRTNFKGLVDFWHELPQKINLIGWVIGEDGSKESLASEFLAFPDGTVNLFHTETLIKVRTEFLSLLSLTQKWQQQKKSAWIFPACQGEWRKEWPVETTRLCTMD
jgi:hypothetical protein